MSQSIAARLTLRKKLLLASAAAAAVALPLAVGLLNASQTASAPTLSFEVASIKPAKPGAPGPLIRFAPGGRFNASGISGKVLMEEAYNVKESQISGAPPWFDSDRFDIDAKPDDSVAAALAKFPPDGIEKLRQMLQSLLTERFKLTLGHETKELPVYALVVAKNGPKFHESASKPPQNLPDSPPPPGKGQGIWMSGRGKLSVTDAGLTMFANGLSRVTGRIVVDKTGLPGNYDFTLNWTPEEGQGPAMPGGPPPGADGAAPPPESSGPSLFTALQEQLGLKLEAQKAPVDILVIEHVEKPSEN